MFSYFPKVSTTKNASSAFPTCVPSTVAAPHEPYWDPLLQRDPLAPPLGHSSEYSEEPTLAAEPEELPRVGCFFDKFETQQKLVGGFCLKIFRAEFWSNFLR